MNSDLTNLRIVTLQTLRRMSMAVFWWTFGVVLYTAVNVLVYPTFKDTALLEAGQYPDAFMEAFGLSDLTAIGPYIYAQVYLMLPLVLAFYPIMTFSNAIAGAEERGALDILMGNPVRRRTIIIATWIAMAIALLVILLVTGLTCWICILLIDEPLSFRQSMQGAWSVFPIALAIGSIALLLSARMRNRGAVIGLSVGIMFLMYLLDVVGKLKEDWSTIRWPSFFRYFGDAISVGVPAWHYLLLIGVALALLVLAVAAFDRRDIYT